MKQDSRRVLVDVVRTVATTRKGAKAASPQLSITFGSGAVGRLNPADPRERAWAEVLASLRESRSPAYIEMNASTGRITALLLPRPQVVASIKDGDQDGDLEVEFHTSQAVHFLRRRHPRFEELRDLLEDSRRSQVSVLVTNSLDSSAIVDVRPVAGGK